MRTHAEDGRPRGLLLHTEYRCEACGFETKVLSNPELITDGLDIPSINGGLNKCLKQKQTSIERN